MTLSHSLFIIVLTIGNIAGALWLLWWMRRSRGETLKTTETTGHVWDGDLRELNNPLPRWWLWLFIITVVFGGVYLALYPGLGNYQGTLGWTSQREHATQFAANAARLEKTLAPFATRSVEELSGDARALDIGRNLFLNNCATCHGSDGGGAPGYPNLTDRDWLWGGEPERVLETVANGRMGVKPAWGEALGPEGTENVLAYVYSLRGQTLPAGNVQAGAAKFAELCSACHGADARGNPALGAPNLTDGVWLHGGALASVRQSIEKGRNGVMPAHLQRLGETRVKLLAAYALSLGRALDETPVAAASGSGGGHAAAGR